MRRHSWCALTLALATLCPTNLGRSATAPFALVLETEHATVQAGSEVSADITLRNSSNRVLQMSLSLPELDYLFDVRDNQNRTPPETELSRTSKTRVHFSNEQSFKLQPGERLPKATLVLTKFYDMSAPGKYTVQVSRQLPKELGGGTVKSNILTITVKPALPADGPR